MKGIKTKMTHDYIHFCSKREPSRDKRFRMTINEWINYDKTQTLLVRTREHVARNKIQKINHHSIVVSDKKVSFWSWNPWNTIATGILFISHKREAKCGSCRRQRGTRNSTFSPFFCCESNPIVEAMLYLTAFQAIVPRWLALFVGWFVRLLGCLLGKGGKCKWQHQTT